MSDKMDIWAQLSAELPKESISWRQDGRPTQRDGKYVARFVAYTDAQVVRERLDTVVPGEWSLTLEMLPHASDADGEAVCAFKACLQVFNVTREDVGQGKDYKSASTDAFKRAAVRFGIGHELYSMGQVWVAVDGDGKYAKPLEDPATVYARKNGNALRGSASVARSEHTPTAGDGAASVSGTSAPAPERSEPAAAPTPFAESFPPPCPKCGGAMWDNRLSKRNAKAPDAKCRNRGCDGVVWPPKPNAARTNRAGRDETEGPYEAPLEDEPVPF